MSKFQMTYHLTKKLSQHNKISLFLFRKGIEFLAPHKIPRDSKQLAQNWYELIKLHKIDAYACVTSCIKRDIISQQEIKNSNQKINNIELSTLSNLANLINQTNKLIHIK